MKVLVTGAAGFIGSFLAKRFLSRGDEVVGLDNINDYYDVNLKYGRLNELGVEKSTIEYNKITKSSIRNNFGFIKLNLEDEGGLKNLFQVEKFDVVCHMAAQAGVRYSIENPLAYVNSNLLGFVNILECCRNYPVKHLVYASSSSIYGLNKKSPFSTTDAVNHPVSLYGASKKSNELMAHAYSHLFKIPTTGLRFFTVYGPWGRPDMAYFLFAQAIAEGRKIKVFNNGNMMRDFTYIDDIVEGIVRVADNPAMPDIKWDAKNPDASSSVAPYKIYNIGNHAPVRLLDFINEIENAMGKIADKDMLPMQPGDVEATYADVDDLENDFGFKPETSLKTGIENFIHWFKMWDERSSRLNHNTAI